MPCAFWAGRQVALDNKVGCADCVLVMWGARTGALSPTRVAAYADTVLVILPPAGWTNSS